ncbi:TonB-dependent receptor plug domain-containing protein [Aureitalea marina]|uniref:TonB-dependent receptor plug domain-containing protein n=1 Tax=Aureitalea marina TaxID=930804 RepID=A0A2S7KN95_9FLAO|nr:TonB-dependent receptor plug domain-containing protein [Aureitalea marina]PQB04082.1 hypothetical protein BST85_03585 [Aureitalea marina]
MRRITLIIVVLVLNFQSHAQEKEPGILLLWDSSLGMMQKDGQAEMEKLQELLAAEENTVVRLKVFSNQVHLDQHFRIEQGQWSELASALKTVVYDGTSSYEGLFEGAYKSIILVSRGKEHIDKLPTYLDTPVYVINSCEDSNKVDLKVLALASEGDYFEMIPDNADVASSANADTTFSRVQTVRNASELATSDSGRREALDVVILEADIQDEPEDEEVNLGDRKRSKKTLGYAVESITSDDIAPTDTDVQQAVKGQFSGLYIQNDTANDDVDLTQFLGRNKNMTILGNQYGLVVIDGVPQASDSSAFGAGAPSNRGRTDHLDPANIHSITYLKGLAATNRYGSLGSGGVLVIKTKTFAATEGTVSQRKKKAKPLGTTATYDGSAATGTTSGQPYLTKISQSSDVNEAYEIYLQTRAKYGSNPSFYIDMASYFNQWGNQDIVDRILSNINELPNAKPADLTAMAYCYQANGMHIKAAQIYKRLVQLDANSIQHYRNLALAYTEADMYKEAEDIYNKLDRGYVKEVQGKNGLKKTLDLETARMVKQARPKTTLRKLDTRFNQLTTARKRIVIEWNYFDAEFDLQIVNPQNRYFTWSHKPDGEPARFREDVEQRIGVEEFVLSDTDQGNWLFNLTSLGSKSATKGEPIYVKVTVYDHFGSPNEQVQTKLIPLDVVGQNRELLSISVEK